MKKILLMLLISSSFLFGQEILLKGKVINKDENKPLEMANITIMGAKKGTVTDNEGNFKILVNQDDKIKISYLGFEEIIMMVSSLDTNEPVIFEMERKLLPGQSVLVEAAKIKSKKSPSNFKVTRKEIEANYVNQDVPEYISYLPSTTFYSEGGASGIGYNYLSIRGFDQRRISVAVNGIPQNDPEDHNVYWVDMPDLLGSTELIQVERGSGSGVIGYPSVGGSINIITSTFSDKPKMDFGVSYGSYNTRKYSAAFSSGLVNQKYSFYAKITQLLSTGYRNLNWMDYKSYHFSAVRYDENLTTQVNIYGGPFEDGLLYEGLPKFAIKDKDLRKGNYSWWSAENGKYTWTSVRRPEEKESFSQPHFEVLNEYKFNENVKFNSALFLILGKGYFDFDGSWADTSYLRLTNRFGFNPSQNPGNTLIRAMVENKQFGWIPRLSIIHDNGRLILGAELRTHRSVHWGSIQYGEALPQGITPDYRYYYYKGGKDIFNFFANEDFKINDKLNLLAEVQLAYHKYKIYDEKYVGTDFTVDNFFVNPRLGLSYKANDNLGFYFSTAIVSREPRLKNYYDAAESSGGATPQFKLNSDGSYNYDEPLVNPERMFDVELGANFNTGKLNASVNLFYMNFRDEIVKKGQLDRFGQPITGNVAKSIHSGIEAVLEYKFNKHLSFVGNATFSNNFIKEGKTYLSYNDKSLEIDLKDNEISGFPGTMFNVMLNFDYKGLFAQLTGKYVGEFRSDNFDDKLTDLLAKYPGLISYDDNKVDSYFVANFYASYQFNFEPMLNNVKLFVQVNNLFDKLYASYAVGKNFFPAAERNILTGISVGL